MPIELLLAGPGELTFAEYDERELGPREVRARGIVSGISHGTELTNFQGRSPFGGKRLDRDLRLFVDSDAEAEYPLRPGYEWVGEVTDVGAAVNEVSVRDRVQAAMPHRETQTVDLDGAVPWSVLPRDLSVERAALLMSATIALQAVQDAQIIAGERVAVFGMGALGLLCVQLCRLNGASFVVAVDPVQRRRELAAELGADWVLDPTQCDVGAEIKRREGARAVDLSIEFSGRYDALHQAIRCVRLAGRVVSAGFYAGGAAELRLGEEWHHNRLTMISSMQGWGAPSRFAGWDRPRLRATALQLLADGSIGRADFVSHRFPLADAAAAYQLIASSPSDVLRVVLTYA
jgi:2-desacetyl-2-hydroxyethyl bacteriochlorophyllide A dehydrogenase